MKLNTPIKFIICLFITQSFTGLAQDIEVSSKLTEIDRLVFYDYRGTNAIDISGGLATINGDYEDPSLNFQFKIGYKRFLSHYLNVNLGFSSFRLSDNTVSFDELYSSVDLNLEFIALPYQRVSPIIYAGYGLVSSKDIDVNAAKIQAGVGVEYIIFDHLGAKLYGEYSYTTTDELKGFLGDAGNDSFFRFGAGINFYFGGSKQRDKIVESQDTVIKSNQILIDN